MRVDDALAFAAGAWRIERWVFDRRSGTEGSFTGGAEFVARPAAPGALSYREEGELRFGGHAGRACRSLLWVRAADGAADVRFADGRPFYPLDLRSGRWHAEHLCGADRYLVDYRVPSSDCIEERWRVRGPDKDYHLDTVLTRLPAAAALLRVDRSQTGTLSHKPDPANCCDGRGSGATYTSSP